MATLNYRKYIDAKEQQILTLNPEMDRCVAEVSKFCPDTGKPKPGLRIPIDIDQLIRRRDALKDELKNIEALIADVDGLLISTKPEKDKVGGG